MLTNLINNIYYKWCNPKSFNKKRLIQPDKAWDYDIIISDNLDYNCDNKKNICKLEEYVVEEVVVKDLEEEYVVKDVVKDLEEDLEEDVVKEIKEIKELFNWKENEKEEEYVVIWEQSKWLVLSSFFFTIPSIYGFCNKLYSPSSLLVVSSLISANYWRKATYSWRRNVDLLFSKLSFSVFAYLGITKVNYYPYMILGYPGLFGMLYCYNTSYALWKLKKKNWINYHMTFHFLLMCEQLLIIDSLRVQK